MTLGLRLTDGTTTITLSNGTTGIVTDYLAGSAAADEAEATDRATVLLLGGREAVRVTVQGINRMMRQAAIWKARKVGVRVYVERDLGDGVWWRSEVLEGLPLPDDSTLDMGLAAGKMTFVLAYTRRNWWEGAEAVLPLSNGHGTNVTTGLLVYPVYDSTHSNWVDMPGASVGGDLPAPIKFELTNTYNHASTTYTTYLSLNRNSAPGPGAGSFPHILEAEAATLGTTTSPINATLYSNGYAKTVTAQTTLGTTLYWTLSGEMLEKAGSNDFRVLARFAGFPPAGTWARVQVTLGGLTVLAQTPTVLLSQYEEVQEVGTVKLPPYLRGSGALGELRLELHLRRTPATAMVVDYVQLAPLDGWRKLIPVGYQLEYGETLVDDQIDGYLYAVWADGIRGYHVAYGGGIALEPGVNQRLYVVAVGPNLIQRTSTVKISYRPRRLTI